MNHLYQSPATSQERYAAIVEALHNTPGVSFGSQGKKGFGSSALKVNDKIFAMIDSKGKFVVKLPHKQVDALIAAGQGERFDPGHGRLMKEWFVVDDHSEQDWLSLAKEALAFVASKR